MPDDMSEEAILARRDAVLEEMRLLDELERHRPRWTDEQWALFDAWCIVMFFTAARRR